MPELEIIKSSTSEMDYTLTHFFLQKAGAIFKIDGGLKIASFLETFLNYDKQTFVKSCASALDEFDSEKDKDEMDMLLVFAAGLLLGSSYANRRNLEGKIFGWLYPSIKVT